MRLGLFGAAALLIQTAGCRTPFTDGVACTDILVPGISVAASDSITGAPLSGAVAVARDGAYVDSTTQLGMIAGERSGTYTVTVRKTGYAPWVRNGVTVTRDECHVKTVFLSAKLQPAP